MKKMNVLAIALSMVAVFAVSALAADWNFYGSARVTTFLTDNDGGTTTYNQGLQGNSRIGANVKVSDELGGRFEYGSSDGNANIRLIYGTWNFGAGQLIVGQTYAPVWMSVSSQAYNGDNGLTGWGENYAGRTPQVQLKYGDFKLALLKPNADYYTIGNVDTKLTDDDTEIDFPAIQVKSRVNIGKNTDLTVSGAYQTFKVGEFDVDSHMIAARVRTVYGPFVFKASAFTGSNVGNIAALDVTGESGRKGHAVVDPDQGVTDIDAIGYTLVGNYCLNEMVSFEAGLGYAEMDDTDNQKTDDVVSYYVQAPLTLAPGVIIVPEIGVVDYKDAGQDKLTYYGAKWQINF